MKWTITITFIFSLQNGLGRIRTEVYSGLTLTDRATNGPYIYEVRTAAEGKGEGGEKISI